MMATEFPYLAFMASAENAGDVGGIGGIVEVQGKEIMGIIGARNNIGRGSQEEAPGDGSAGEEAHIGAREGVALEGGEWNRRQEGCHERRNAERGGERENSNKE
jgi:hypothetical protein